MTPDRAALIAHFPFPLDGFQLRALDALDAGQSVLVAAPTGSGKTAVAEYAVDAAVSAGLRAFYTAPIKALSNQKYHDLCERLGGSAVGLLTGDNSINPDADVIVMTTEVLRNMIYSSSSALDRLGVVVLDEVHFLQDAYRGPVWEEVIIHLPLHVRLVCLSATVSNANELADWIGTVRGPTTAVVEERRPVRLDNLYLIGDRTQDRLHLLPVLVDGRPNGDAVRLDSEATRPGRHGRQRQGRPQAKRKLYTPTRTEVLELLDQRGMLPAIHFIFSRNQCDEAARAAAADGLVLTSAVERERITEIAASRLSSMSDDDLAVLGHQQFLTQLEAGIAAHHAGLVPPFKEVVEQCFIEGLVKIVYATETLAVGINMPAKTVIIERLTKFTGDHHTFLTPGEYTQLTGRAGRRGMDELGNSIVLWSPFVPFDQVATLAASRSFHLTSAFRPTYNMAANLVRRYSRERAHHLLNLSFAQYQADGEVVRLETRLHRAEERRRELTEQSRSPYGDVDEYLRHATGSAPDRSDEARTAIATALERLRPGDVLYVEKGRYAGRGAVLTTSTRRSDVRISVVTSRREVIRLAPDDFSEVPMPIGHIDLPSGFAPNRTDYLRQVVSRLDRAEVQGRPRRLVRVETVLDEYPHGHPVERDPDLRDRLKAAGRAQRAAREVDEIRARMAQRRQSVAADFDRVHALLEDFGYLRGWTLSDAGDMLAGLFHECDLLVAECLRGGLLDGLDAPSLAGLVSVFVYEHRSPDEPLAPWFPNPDVRRRWQQIAETSYRLQSAEERAGLGVHRPPDPTFLAVAWAWAAGEGFADVVAEEDMSGGDFVRTTKQLIDLLRQIAIVAPQPETRRTAGAAADLLFRGVVSASSAVDAAPPGEPT